MKFTAIALAFALLAVTCDSSPTTPTYAIQIKSDTAFCSFMPPHPGDNVGATENDGVPRCSDSSLGGPVFPEGFIQSAHYESTPNYVQITGTIDRTKYNLKATDGGGQYDNKDIVSATCNGYKYFVNLIEPDANIFCIRCCKSQGECKTGISTKGCETIVPGNYQ